MVFVKATRFFFSVPIPRLFTLPNVRPLSFGIPSRVDPYLRLARYDKPIGTWLLYLPCTWSIALASTPGELPSFSMLALFGVGAMLMRGAGCTVNDLLDKKLDQQVARTKTRPLAANEITTKNALAFLGLQLSASLLILTQLNGYCIALGLVSMVPVLTYPLFKRFTHWPQLLLGIAFNWGSLMGYAAVVGHLDLSTCIPLYLMGINWTLIYDTIYAFQDIEDDRRIGVKSLAILLEDNAKAYFTLFQAAMTLSLVAVGIASEAGWMYFAGSVVTMAHLSRLVYNADLRNPESCMNAFKANRNTGLIYFGTIVLDKYLAVTG